MNPLANVDTPPVRASDDSPTVLIVDGDRVSERAVELALAPCGFTVEWARDGEAAVEIMRHNRIDVVIADTVLSDVAGGTLMRRTIDLCGPSAPSFIFVSADRAVGTRVALLVGGATDYLVKPFNPEELRARVLNTIALRRSAHRQDVSSVSGLVGDSRHVSIPDLLTMLEFSRKSGVIEISVGASTGRLHIDGGRVVHAAVATLSGTEAFFMLLQSESSVFRYVPGEIEAPHTLNARVSELLLESAVREDTAKHWIEDPIRTQPGLREQGITKMSIQLRARTDLPTASLASVATRGIASIADPFLLGDLHLGSGRSAHAKPALRVELWTSVTRGIAAMLGLASPPGHSVLLAALGGEAEWLQLEFEVDELVVVVTLVDAEGSSGLPEQAPHAMIVAPPDGELVAMAPARLADLAGRAGHLPSPVVLGLGNASLQSALRPLCGRGSRFSSGSIEVDPRAVLCDMIRLWIAAETG